MSFKKLHDDLRNELLPTGPLEEDIVLSIARLLWRKQNMSTYRAVEWTQNEISRIHAIFSSPEGWFSVEKRLSHRCLTRGC